MWGCNILKSMPESSPYFSCRTTFHKVTEHEHLVFWCVYKMWYFDTWNNITEWVLIAQVKYSSRSESYKCLRRYKWVSPRKHNLTLYTIHDVLTHEITQLNEWMLITLVKYSSRSKSYMCLRRYMWVSPIKCNFISWLCCLKIWCTILIFL